MLKTTGYRNIDNDDFTSISDLILLYGLEETLGVESGQIDDLDPSGYGRQDGGEHTEHVITRQQSKRHDLIHGRFSRPEPRGTEGHTSHLASEI